MRRLPPLLLSLVLSSCSTPRRAHEYPNGLGQVQRIIQTDPTEIGKVCNVSYFDDGTPISIFDEIIGCWKPDTGTIYIYNGPEALRVLLHELCHAGMELKPVECDRRY